MSLESCFAAIDRSWGGGGESPAVVVTDRGLIPAAKGEPRTGASAPESAPGADLRNALTPTYEDISFHDSIEFNSIIDYLPGVVGSGMLTFSSRTFSYPFLFTTIL